MPKVTVYLTSFNHAKYIGAAIESVLNQTFTDFELIIWDDASTDESWSIIKRYEDPRIRAFRNEENTGGTIGFDEKLANLVKGEFIAIHHSDDVWEVDKLEKQVNFLESHPDVGAVFTHVQIIGEDGGPFKRTDHFYSSIFQEANRTRHEWLRFFFMKGNALCHPSVLIRKSCFEKCGSYRHDLWQLPDFDMWVRLCLQFDIHIIQEKLTKFRVRDGNANASAWKRDTSLRTYFEYHQIVYNYLKIDTFEEFEKVFPEAKKYFRQENTNLSFALAMVNLELKPYSFSEMFGLNLLQTMIHNPEQAVKLKEHYGFDYKSLFELTGKYDPYSILPAVSRSRSMRVELLFKYHSCLCALNFDYLCSLNIDQGLKQFF